MRKEEEDDDQPKLILDKLTIEEAAAAAEASLEARHEYGVGVPRARTSSEDDDELESKRLVQSKSILEERRRDQSRDIAELQELVNELEGGGNGGGT